MKNSYLLISGQSLEHQINRKQWEIQLKPYQLAKAKLISCLKGGLLSNIASAEDPTPAQMMIAQLTGIECKVSSRLVSYVRRKKYFFGNL
jgi:hypothetical protein